MRTLIVALAGAAGALCRYGVGLAVGPRTFPWGTLGINLAGSLVLGLVLSLAASRHVSHDVTVPLAVGFLGAFTTFSTFAYEAYGLLRAAETGKALLYVTLSVVLGVAGAAAGYQLGRLVGR